ncbi:Starch-binding associating with outer membrane [Porphyromonadaceae bacterium KH3CP3RA]|nr:Starch-binding associating with outer membrane [Porphyromonadaceae bacterium KH3CP3RA]
MKTFIKNTPLLSIITLVLILSITSCNDALDVMPKDRMIPENYFRNENELQMFSNKFYTQLPGESAIIREGVDHIAKNDMSDELKGTRIIPGSGSGWTWDQLRDINTLLEYSVNCPDREIRNKYNAVARFFRAYFYFEKVKRFGDVPWYDKQLASNDPELKKSQDSREFIMAKVIEDLDFAIQYLPAKKELYRVTKWTALALKSRVCLFEGTFRKYHGLTVDGVGYEYYLEQAVKAGEDFINQSGYGLYRGESSTTVYRDLFASLTARGEEIILARNYNKSLGQAHNANFYTLGVTYGRPGLTKRMVNSYLMADGTRFTDREGYETYSFAEETQNRDPRLSQTIRTPGYRRIGGTATLVPDLLTTATGYQPIKYVMESKYDGPNTESECDMPIFRTAEVYLNLAEAKAELGTLTQSDLDKTIGLLRARVGMPALDMAEANAEPDPYLLDPKTGYPQVKGQNQGIILEIRRERTIELIMEGFRYYDMMRWKEGKTFETDYHGIYIPGLGLYDFDEDGKDDVYFYKGSLPSVPAGVLARKVDEEIFLSNGESGYISPYKNFEAKWNEERDYLYPIPLDERMLTGGNLKQNPGWEDGLEF